MKNLKLVVVLLLVTAAAVAQEKPKNPLVGNWLATEEGTKVEIRANGTLTIDGAEYAYKVKNSVITVISDDGIAAMPYILEGDTLTVEFEGREIVYKRVKPGSGGRGVGQGSGVGTGAGAGSGGDQAVMQALVGKWCYLSSMTGSNSFMSSRCFVLHPNGTYEYSSENSTSGGAGSTVGQSWDAGRWSATRTTLTANSNSGSRTVYPIELRNHPKTGDPMIVVDGDAYVTAYQKRSW